MRNLVGHRFSTWLCLRAVIGATTRTNVTSALRRTTLAQVCDVPSLRYAKPALSRGRFVSSQRVERARVSLSPQATGMARRRNTDAVDQRKAEQFGGRAGGRRGDTRGCAHATVRRYDDETVVKMWAQRIRSSGATWAESNPTEEPTCRQVGIRNKGQVVQQRSISKPAFVAKRSETDLWAS